MLEMSEKRKSEVSLKKSFWKDALGRRSTKGSAEKRACLFACLLCVFRRAFPRFFFLSSKKSQREMVAFASVTDTALSTIKR